MPSDLVLLETVPLRECHECGYVLLERDRYCRRCGIWQPERERAGNTLTTLRFAARNTLPSPPVYRSVSGPLVNAVTNGIAARTTAQLQNRVAQSLVVALISLPIWLLIVLLSPLDAWVATRAATTQL